MRRWVTEKHDIITAEDMTRALESHGDLRGCRAAVVRVDSTKEVGKCNKIPGISLLNNFSFKENGTCMLRAYNVGPGRLLPYAQLNIEKQGDTSLKIIQPFGPRTKQRSTVMESTRPTAEIFSYSESGCVLTFKTEAEADAHMDSGKHIRELESESLYDTIRKKWAEKVSGVNLVSHVREPNAVPEVQTSSPSINSRRSRGEDSHMKVTGMLVGKLELNP